ncbi:hypothetical protein ACRAWD_02515 [Caulobacter segnis]
MVKDVWSRVEKAAEGAAIATGTTVDKEITGGVYALLPNDTLGRVMDANLRKVGGITWTPEEVAFAKKMQTTLVNPPSIDTVKTIEPYKVELEGGGGSTDVSDISWVTPTVGPGHGDLRPRLGRPQLAGRGRRRLVDRREGRGQRRQDAGPDRRGPVRQPRHRQEGQGRDSTSVAAPTSPTRPCWATARRPSTTASPPRRRANNDRLLPRRSSRGRLPCVPLGRPAHFSRLFPEFRRGSDRHHPP